MSGLGSSAKASGVRHDSTSLFAHADLAHPGIIKIDFLRDGRVRLAVVEKAPDAPEGVEVYSTNLERSGEGGSRRAKLP